MWNSPGTMRVRALCTATLLLISPIRAICQSPVLSQGAGKSKTAKFAAPNSARKVFDHLDSVVRWYRQWDGADVYVNRPGDELYIQNGQMLAREILRLEFKSALAQSALTASAKVKASAVSSASQDMENAQDIVEKKQQVSLQIDNLKTELTDLSQRISHASFKQRADLIAQRNVLQGQLELAQALQENLQQLTAFMANVEIANGQATELSGKILALQKSLPAAQVGAAEKNVGAAIKQPGAVKVAAQNAPSGDVSNQGLIGQVSEIFRLLGSLRSVHQLAERSAALQSQTQQLRAPLLVDLRSTLKQGQVAISVASPAPPQETSKPSVHAHTTPSHASTQGNASQNAPAQAVQSPPDMAALLRRFKLLSEATLPLSQELILIEQSESDLAQLQSSIERDYAAILRSVLLRVAGILFLLGLIWLFSELWRRATFRYIQDARRRRQFLVLRRVITGFCMFLKRQAMRKQRRT